MPRRAGPKPISSASDSLRPGRRVGGNRVLPCVEMAGSCQAPSGGRDLRCGTEHSSTSVWERRSRRDCMVSPIAGTGWLAPALEIPLGGRVSDGRMAAFLHSGADAAVQEFPEPAVAANRNSAFSLPTEERRLRPPLAGELWDDGPCCMCE